MAEQIVGSTRAFVLAKGLTQVGNHAALIGEDDTRRLFAELYANPDRPEVRPQEAYQAILSSMQPGWTLRLLQLFWPDPEPRMEFQQQVQNWYSHLAKDWTFCIRAYYWRYRNIHCLLCVVLYWNLCYLAMKVLHGRRDLLVCARVLVCRYAF